jgi:DNA (cytosine-5)-methyltransferase 1
MPQSRKTRQGETVGKLRLLRENGAQANTDDIRQAVSDPDAVHRAKGDPDLRARAVREHHAKLTGYAESPKQSPNFRFIDLFAGIGGMRLGFQQAGGQCVFSCEWDEHAVKTYKANFGADERVAGDITNVESKDVPAHDVLVAGFPCQPFSIAGVSKKNALGRPHGFACEAQGTLFFELARLLHDLKPKAFLLENVKNLRTHDGGRTFSTIMQVLEEELGYCVSPRVINARPWVPQHRERILLVGFKDSVDFSWDSVIIPATESAPRLKSILHPEDGTEPPEYPYTDEQGNVNAKYSLTPHLWSYLQSYAKKHRAKGNGFGFGLVGPNDVARTLSARYYKDGSEILVRTRSSTPRRLTPRECARLMGFDRGEGATFKIPVSDTQAYKQFGNSVVVPVIGAVADAMRRHMTGEATGESQLRLQIGSKSA